MSTLALSRAFIRLSWASICNLPTSDLNFEFASSCGVFSVALFGEEWFTPGERGTIYGYTFWDMLALAISSPARAAGSMSSLDSERSSSLANSFMKQI